MNEKKHLMLAYRIIQLETIFNNDGGALGIMSQV